MNDALDQGRYVALTAQTSFFKSNGELCVLPEDIDAPICVIDLGSGHWKSATYGRGRWPKILSEIKISVDLSRGMYESGKPHLNPDSVNKSIASIPELLKPAMEHGAQQIYVFATEAIRKAVEYGDETVIPRINRAIADYFASAGRANPPTVRIISGNDEARLAANGLLLNFPLADGIVVDLGTGSLELAHVRDGKILRTTSLSLGPRSLESLAHGNREEAAAYVQKELSKIEWLKDLCQQSPTLYLTGGHSRSMGRIIRDKDYPFEKIHGFSIDGNHFEKKTGFTAGIIIADTPDLRALVERRIETIDFASLVIHGLSLFTKPSHAVFVRCGMRDGISRLLLTEEERTQSPLVHACKNSETAISDGAAMRLQEWLKPLFKNSEFRPEIIQAISYLSRAGDAFDGENSHKAQEIYEAIMKAKFGDCFHNEKAFMALTLYARYAGDKGESHTKIARHLLDDAQTRRAVRVGLAIKLAYELSADLNNLSPEIELDIGDHLKLVSPEQLPKPKRDAALHTLREMADTMAPKVEISVIGKDNNSSPTRATRVPYGLVPLAPPAPA